MKKINIIQFLPYYPPHKGGLETHTQEWGKWWMRKWYWDVYNIITDFGQSYLLWEEIIFDSEVIWYKKDWVENLLVPSFEIIPNFPIYKFWNRKYRIIILYLKEKNINLIITRTRFFLTTLIGWLFARKNKIKWCHIEHGSDYVKLNAKWKNIVTKVYDKIIWKWIFKKANKVVWISEACKRFIRKEFIYREVDVIYRGIDLNDINSKKRWAIKLVFIWRLVKLKGVEDLLKAYSKIKIDILLDIIWDGEELQKLQNIVNSYNITNVSFLWIKDKNFIVNYLSKNKCIFVNTSYQEWLPSWVIESLFYKNITIASDVWWTKEISNKEDLILFKAWDINWLLRKIEYSFKRYNKLVWKSYIFIKNRFTWERNIEKYYNFLIR